MGCIVLVLLLIASLRSVWSYQFPYSEFLALEDFYNSLNGDHWHWHEELSHDDPIVVDDFLINIGTNTNIGPKWNFTGFHNPCAEAWQGVNCSCSNATSFRDLSSGTNCTVISLELAAYNLSGTIPSTIDMLPNLRVLFLASNSISGTLPYSIAKLSNLHFLNVADNKLGSSIPYYLADCTKLQHLHLEYNEFEGTIPAEIYTMTQLYYFSVADNKLHGEFSPLFGQLHQLRYLYISDNEFTGTIPEELGNCTEMLELYLYNNSLHGNITFSLSYMGKLNFLYLFGNMLTGSIPSWIGASNQLYSFDAGLNHLTGSIPSSLCDNSNYTIGGLLLNGNLLTGTIPSCLGGSNSPVAEIILYNNHLTGTIPVELSLNHHLESLVVGFNHLTGTVPPLKTSKLMEYIYVQHNLLTGNLYDVVDPEKQLDLLYLDFSSNEFTGTIPESFYQLRFVESIALVSNCFTGSLSDGLCNMTRLQYLDFDGLHTAHNCQNRFFSFLDSYYMKSTIHGTIPPCVFNLPRLQTIHLSGNAMDSTLPNDLVISDSLADITLSHNKLRGNIPITLQTRSFNTLDLSYNCFDGGLHNHFNLSDYTYLEVNRLSGVVPETFRHAENIKVLNSNMFGCDIAKTTLPLNDPEFTSYQCGSNAFNQSLIIWSVLCGTVMVIIITALLARLKRNNPYFKVLHDKYEVYIAYVENCMMVFYDKSRPHGNIFDFAEYLDKLRVTFLRITIGVCLVLLPLYLILSRFYSTTSHEYAWNASALYLTGEAPAIILFFVFLGLLVVVFWSLRKLLLHWLTEEALIDDATSNETHITHLSFNRRRFVIMCVVASLNCAMMLVLNGLYVYFVFEYNPFIVFVCQLMIAVVKIFWNEYALTWMVRTSREKTKLEAAGRPLSRAYSTESSVDGTGQIHHCAMDRERDLHELKELQDLQRLEDANDMPVLTFIVIFNTIIAPVIANSVVSDQCYESVFFPPKSITSVGDYSICYQQYSLEVTNVLCRTKSEAYLQTTYDPPFIYRYGCSSSFIRHYASVYVYMFLLTGFGKPVGFALWKHIYDTTKSYHVRWLMSLFLNKMLKEDLMNEERLQSTEILFRKERFVLNNVSATCVLLTVGVVFPPLAVVVLFAIYSHTYMNQFIIGRFVRYFQGITQELVLKNLNNDCDGVAILFKNSLLFMIPFTACFYAFYLLDIYGDAVGWRKAMWTSIIVFAMPILVFFSYNIYRIFAAVTRQRNERQEAQEKIGRNRAATAAAMQRSSYFRRSSEKGSFWKTMRDSSVVAGVIHNPMAATNNVEMTSRETQA